MDQRLLEIFDDMLDKHFPKGKCEERGHALVLIAEAMIAIEKEWLPRKIEEFHMQKEK